VFGCSLARGLVGAPTSDDGGVCRQAEPFLSHARTWLRSALGSQPSCRKWPTTALARDVWPRFVWFAFSEGPVWEWLLVWNFDRRRLVGLKVNCDGDIFSIRLVGQAEYFYWNGTLSLRVACKEQA
jgi:hypothetical protein